MMPFWVACDSCDEFWCGLHGAHVFECDCPDIEEMIHLVDPRWGGDPRAAFDPDWEAGCPRVVTDERDRRPKLAALGNAIVPQVAYEIFRAIQAVNIAEGYP